MATKYCYQINQSSDASTPHEIHPEHPQRISIRRFFKTIAETVEKRAGKRPNESKDCWNRMNRRKNLWTGSLPSVDRTLCMKELNCSEGKIMFQFEIFKVVGETETATGIETREWDTARGSSNFVFVCIFKVSLLVFFSLSWKTYARAG